MRKRTSLRIIVPLALVTGGTLTYVGDVRTDTILTLAAGAGLTILTILFWRSYPRRPAWNTVIRNGVHGVELICLPCHEHAQQNPATTDDTTEVPGAITAWLGSFPPATLYQQAVHFSAEHHGVCPHAPGRRKRATHASAPTSPGPA